MKKFGKQEGDLRRRKEVHTPPPSKDEAEEREEVEYKMYSQLEGKEDEEKKKKNLTKTLQGE